MLIKWKIAEMLTNKLYTWYIAVQSILQNDIYIHAFTSD